MARGIDTSAHEGGLDTGTIAVLGSCVTFHTQRKMLKSMKRYAIQVV